MNKQLDKRIQEQKEFLKRFYDRIFAPIKCESLIINVKC